MTHPRKIAGFWWHVTKPDPTTGLRGFGVYRPGFEICRRRWDGVFWITLGRYKIVQTKPINGTRA